jgi:hypothetical protein
MYGQGTLSRDVITLRAGDLATHLASMSADAPVIVELPDGTRYNVRSASDPGTTDMPWIVLEVADDFDRGRFGL